MLREIFAQKREIEVGSLKFEVRGLVLDDLVALISEHSVELEAMFSGKLTPDQLVVSSPLLAAKLIAMASDEPDAVSNARQLPLSVQLKALASIWDLSVVDEDEFVKLVRGLVAGMARLGAKMGVPDVSVVPPKKRIVIRGKGLSQ